MNKITDNIINSSVLLDEEKKYWYKKLEDIQKLSSFNLNFEKTHPICGEEKSIQKYTISTKILEKIGNICNNSNYMIYTFLLAGFMVVLHKHNTEEKNLVVGMPNFKIRQENNIPKNILLLKSIIDPEMSFKKLLLELKSTISQADKYHKLPYTNVLRTLHIDDNELVNYINLVVLLDNIHVEADECDKDILFRFSIKEKKLCLIAEYKNIFDKAYIDRIIQQLIMVYSNVINDVDKKLSEIDILNEDEKNRVLIDFNNTKTNYPKDKAIQQIFEEQVRNRPESVAIVYGQCQLTYRELNSKANQLTRKMIELGIKPNEIIGLITERSIEMVIGMVAVLKAGCAYLPIDPKYPKERKQFMVDDGHVSLLLICEQDKMDLDYHGVILNLGDNSLYSGCIDNIDTNCNGNSLAYIMYTSGSTGWPKGVMVEHRNVIRLVKNTNYINFTQQDAILQTGAVVFDASTFEIWGSLLNGIRLCLVDNDVILNRDKLEKAIESLDITIMWLTSSLFNQLSQDKPDMFKKLNYLLVGGEVLSSKHINQVRKSCPNLKVINGYGPTENTTFSICHLIEKDYEQNIPIGKPISNSTAYIIGENNKLQPIGVAGELLVGGDGVARGYLNNTELTKEKFIDNPFVTGERAYRTGDLARWLPDGNIEFLGRIDGQVKIRGYRIEPKEIETVLTGHKDVKEAVVLVKTDQKDNKYLCAYLVIQNNLSVREIREYLSGRLPDYMVPSDYIEISKIPLTLNGKVDIKALSETRYSMSAGVSYEAPSNKMEEKLVEIWKEVLGAEQVGIRDNFFELGGDSIKAIQVAAHLNNIGLKLEIRDLLQNPTIKELGMLVEEASTVSQEVVVGEIEFTPIQNWFFEQHLVEQNHFNQAFMLFRKQGYDEEIIINVFNKIVEHHDALRMVYKQKGNRVIQYIRGIDNKLYGFEVCYIDDVNYNSKIEQVANKTQASMNLEKGPLVKLVLFKTIDGDALLIVIHHLVVDVVSWRIIFQDFNIGYNQCLNQKEICLPQKTSSFKAWSEGLMKYAERKELLKEVSYWSRIAKKQKKIQVDSIIDTRKKTNLIVSTISFSQNETNMLLKKTNKAFNTEVNDLLLIALGLSINKWQGLRDIVVNIEGHGREEIIKGINITRTVGWFTSMFPVLLTIDETESLSETIKRVKEDIRRVPNKGIGYQIIKYLGSKEDRKIIEVDEEISFNYLGELTIGSNSELFEISNRNVGQSISSNNSVVSKITINAMILNEELAIDFHYFEKEYKSQTIEELMHIYKENLLKLITYCVNKKNMEKTPSDYGEVELDLKDINKIYNKDEIQSIYKLSKMQEAILLSHLLDENSQAYFEQIVFKLDMDIDTDLFQQSFNAVINRYDILRTNFAYKDIKQIRQIVYKQKNQKINYLDISELDASKQSEYIEKFKERDKNTRFNLEKDSLIRLSLIKRKESSFTIVLSFHHIIIDGWCTGILLNDFYSIYKSLQKNESVVLEETIPYKKYIEWLYEQNQEELIQYWRTYLEGYTIKAQIPRFSYKNKNGHYRQRNTILTISKDKTEKLVNISNKCNVTLSIVIQTIYGIFLQKYNNLDDIVFGIVVSGRSAEVKGIEKMVGLLINTIPVRIKDNGDTFTTLVKKVYEDSLKSQKYHYGSLAEIQATSALNGELIDHILVYENYPFNEENSLYNLVVKDAEIFEQTNYDFNVMVIPGDELVIKFIYNSEVYDSEYIQGIASNISKLIDEITSNAESQINDLSIISDAEKRKVLIDFNNTTMNYEKNRTIIDLFAEQVEKTPNNVAVVFGDKRLTYKELNMKANQLANALVKSGVKTETIVGLLIKPSVEIVIAILGILKAGGAYLPIDTEYPENRIKFMLEDCNVDIIISTEEKMDLSMKHIININEFIYDNYSKEDLCIKYKSNQLAYIIYTSGTTGKPKGVMIEHKGISNLKYWFEQQLGIGTNERILQFASISFDAFAWELYMALLLGNSLYITDKDTLITPSLLNKFIKENYITTATLPPFVASILQENTKLKRLITAGSELKAASVAHLVGSIEVINAYGPTEDTICTTYYKIEDLDNTKIPIGKPISNHKVMIVNKQNGLVPIGVPGELCILGGGLARGYLNREDLTRSKFICNPYASEERMYKTGDLARWLPDGNIEFIGRIDQQVKLRGYRIELGEIESVIKDTNNVQDVVAVVKEDQNGNNVLVAYVVSKHQINVMEIKDNIKGFIPAYMLPQYIIQINSIPLTLNGKLDQKALPQIELNCINEYHAPRNEIESKLIQVFSDVLKREHVGIKDNFFELGGDSIKAMQISTRLNSIGLNLKVRDLLKKPTISQLSALVGDASDISQDIVTGEVEFTPIQKWFFEQHLADPNHFNQAFMLYSKQGYDEETIVKVFDKVVLHHDALRMAYTQKRNRITQSIKSIDDNLYDFKVYYIMDGDYKSEIEQVAKGVQASMNLEKGPLVKLVLFKTGNGDELLIVIHHLVVDVVSWRIIFEDFNIGYNQCLKQEEICLPKKTSSFKEWSIALMNYAKRKELLNERAYWRGIAEKQECIQVDHAICTRKTKDINTLTKCLSHLETDMLLSNTNRAYNTEVNDLLLAALCLSINKWQGLRNIVVNIEGHGREEIVKGINVTRTVGWFTSIYPILFTIDGTESLSEVIKTVKEEIRRVPNKGVGYQILKYLSPERNGEYIGVREDINFNYLGQLDTVGDMEFSDISTGDDVGQDNEIKSIININAIILDGKLMININYSKYEFKQNSINEFANHYKRDLLEIIDHCANNTVIERTPSDYGDIDLDSKDLEEIWNQMN